MKKIRDFLLKEEPVKVDGGVVYKNISRIQFLNLFDSSQYKEVRLMKNKKDGLWYGFDGSDMIHAVVARDLGIADPYDYRNDLSADEHYLQYYDFAFTIKKIKLSTYPEPIYMVRFDGKHRETFKQIQGRFESALKDARFHKLFKGLTVYFDPDKKIKTVVENTINEDAISINDGRTIVYRNINQAQLMNILSNSEGRLMMDPKEGIWYGWDAFSAIHGTVAAQLGFYDSPAAKRDLAAGAWDTLLSKYVKYTVSVKEHKGDIWIWSDQHGDKLERLVREMLKNERFRKLMRGKTVKYLNRYMNVKGRKDKDEEWKKFIVEDMVNIAGAGAIAGIGVGDKGDPPMPKKRKKRKITLLRRKPVTESVVNIHTKYDKTTVYINPTKLQVQGLVDKGIMTLRFMRDIKSGVWYMWNGFDMNHYFVEQEFPKVQFDSRFEIFIERGQKEGTVFRIFHDASMPDVTRKMYQTVKQDPKFMRIFPGPVINKWSDLKEDYNDMQHFAGNRIFEVDPEFYHKCVMGKRRYDRYEKYVGNDDMGQEIRMYGLKNPGKPIILKNKKSGGMLYLRYGKYTAEKQPWN